MATWSRIIPLFLFIVFLIALAIIIWIVYSIMMDIRDQTAEKMRENNVTFSKGGVTVGVKELDDEEYRDKSQSVLVSLWNLSPQYKQRLLFGRKRNGSPSPPQNPFMRKNSQEGRKA